MKFKALLTRVILENMEKIDFLIDTYAKPKQKEDGTTKKPKLSIKELAALISADPSSQLNDVDIETANAKELKKAKAGGYTPWIIKQYLNVNQQTETPYGSPGYDREVKMLKERFMEDLYKLKNDLEKFKRFKTRIPEEQRKNAFKAGFTPKDLYELVKDFSLEKIKASKEEKQKAAETYEHPGAEVAFRGSDWTVIKISDKSKLGFDAAQFYGGYYLEPSQGETRWCTSSPGLQWFDRYIKDGPLYVVIPNNWSGKKGIKSGLPSQRYQFHFPSNQFMDPSDSQQNLIQLLNGPMKELKEYFKPEFAKGLTVGDKKLVIDSFESGNIGKFIGLYGLDDLIENMPPTITAIQISNKDKKNDVIINVPPAISRFKDLQMIMFDNCIQSLPDEVCKLKELRFIAVVNCPKVTTVPECIADLPNLLFLNLRGSENIVVPEKIKENFGDCENGMWEANPTDCDN